MTLLTKTARCLAMVVAAMACTGVIGRAQTVAPTSGSATCVASGATGLSYSFTPAAGQTLTGWYTIGDLQITAGASPLANPVTVSSSGFGRGRIVAQYTSGASCQQEASYTVNKTFAQSNASILGPACVVPGMTYGYIASPPLVSSPAQIANNIGIDSYTWVLPNGATGVFSGDRSAVVVTMPATFTGSPSVRVTIGACNNPATEFLEIPLFIQPAAPFLELAPGSAPATCKTDLSAFTLRYTAAVGINYTWSGLPTGWSISLPGSTSSTSNVGVYTTPGPKTAIITPSTAAFADISVTATNPTGGGGCTVATSNVFSVTSQLTTAANAITPSVTGCLTPGTSITFSFANPFPLNTAFQWTLPSGWTPTASTSNSITVTVGTGPGNVIAQVAGCTTGGSVLAVRVSGATVPNTGSGGGTVACGYRVTDNGCGVYQALRNAPLPVSSDCLAEQYYWTIVGPNGLTIASSQPNTAAPLNNTANSFTPPAGVGVPAGSTVTVVATKSSNCLRVVRAITTTSDFEPGVTCRGVNPGNDEPGPSSPIIRHAAVYPNPTGSFLQVDLPVGKAGVSQLTLADALGRVVLNKATAEGRLKLDVRHLPAGIYTLYTTVPGGKKEAQNVMIQH